ncbi:FHA domain-containing protein [Microbacterium protaetiae]|uniref:FHA domain-containing protein n=1 Tax=Microbacterium protaetiae TaxID=2509458 RepID=A0A4P6EDI5_9MICO|nr:FHA domain-containing protein [Microbacterium protaetiae]QAY59129.1 FHA domain-containing protein [Microbacterium protaetiae]
MTAHAPVLRAATACAVCGSGVPAGADACPQCGAVQIRPATIAARMAAVTVDIAAVAIVTCVVILATRSVFFGIVAAVEATLALWILQARTGAGLGNALMRLRTARMDKPDSPGGGRTLVRGACTAVGLCVLAVGAWLLELTGAADRSGWRRSWADRLAGTVVVEVPRRAHRAKVSALAPAAPVAPVIERPAPIAPSMLGVPAPVREVPAAKTDAPRRRRTATPVSATPVAAAVADAAIAAPRRASAVPAEPVSVLPALDARAASVLLVFDTGQRAPVPVPCAVDLGRNPTPVENGDLVISVDDPGRTVSKVHARLEITATDAWVTDLGSTNGSDLIAEDGAARPLTAHRRTLVEDGMRVRVGDRTVTMTRLTGADV